MKNTMKKTLSLLLALTMVLSLGLPAYAVGTTDEDEIISAEEPALQPIAAGKITDFGDDEIISEDQIINLGDLEDLTVEEIEFAPAQDFSFSDELNGFAVEVSAPAGALPLGTEMIVNRLVDLTPVQNAVDKAEDLNGRVRLAADISFWLEGKEVEPAEGTKLVVRMSAPEIEDVVEPVVIHIPDGENAAPEIVEQLRSGDVLMADTVSFEAGEFSIYAILDDGSTVLPGQERRWIYKFYNTDGTEYIFEDVTGQKLNSQIIKNGEALDDIGIPTVGSSQNAKFAGWYVVPSADSDEYGEPVRFGQAITGITSDETIYVKAKMQGIVNVFFFTAALEDDQHNILERSFITVKQIEYTVGQTDPITVDVSDVTTEAPADMAVVGWNRNETAANAGTKEDVNGVITLYADGNVDPITDVMLFPAIAEAYWLYFDENDGGTGGGASYTPPQYVEVGQKPTRPTDPHRTGYTFGGWYKDAACTTEFDFDKVLEGTTTVFAKWNGAQTTYTIIVKVQSTTDALRVTSSSNLSHDDKTYDFWRAYTVNANTGGTATVAQTYKNLANTIDSTGYITYETCDEDTTVKGDGSTVLYVYYQRRVMIMHWRNSQYGTDYDTYYGLYDASLAEAGYTWKTDRKYQDRSHAVVTIIDSFRDFTDGDSVTLWPTTVSSYRTVTMYKDDLDGNWVVANEFEPSSNYSSFNLSNKYKGFDLYQYRVDGGTWRTASVNQSVSYNRTLEIRFKRASYDLTFHNGAQGTDGTVVQTDSVLYQAPLADQDVPTVTYPVAADADHWEFFGWFADSGWKTMVLFSEDQLDEETKQNYKDWYGVADYVVITEMPAHNIPLYAGYHLKGWDCALDPNGGEFTNPNQAGVFWLDYGDLFSSDIKTNIAREGYVFQGWMVANVDGALKITTNPDNNLRYISDDSNWTMTDTPWQFNTGITGPTYLMAKWFYKTVMHVVYDAVEGSNAPVDEGGYSDHATTVAYVAPTPPANKFFLGWDIKGTDTVEKLVPGDTFEVSSDYAVNGVVTLQAVYGSTMNPDDPVPATYIDWYANNTTTAEYYPRDPVTHMELTEEAKQEERTHVTDFPLQLNENVEIRPATEFTNFGYVFLGWAKLHKDGDKYYDHNNVEVKAPTDGAIMDFALTEDNLYLKYENGEFKAYSEGEWKKASYVAADEHSPYEDMYAVWDVAYFYVYHTGAETNNVEKHKVDEAKKNGEIVGFNLTENIPEGKLYGGYYSDYAGKPDSFDPAKLTYDENGKATATKTVYDGTNATFDGSKAYGKTEDNRTGLNMIPEAGEVYYVKEVPAADFLKHRMKFTYNTAGGKIGASWLFTNSDDANYQAIGFSIASAENLGSMVDSITITPLNKPNQKQTFTVASLFNNKGTKMGYKLVYWDTTAFAEGVTVFGENTNLLTGAIRNFWVTPDGLKVTNSVSRTYSNIDRAYKISAADDTTSYSIQIAVYGANTD